MGKAINATKAEKAYKEFLVAAAEELGTGKAPSGRHWARDLTGPQYNRLQKAGVDLDCIDIDDQLLIREKQ